MVHALEEVRRVLVPSGWMLDLRPVSAQWPLHIISAEGVWAAGIVDGSPFMTDEAAANSAIATAQERKLFHQERRGLFEIAYYWPNLEEMEAYAADAWTNSAVLPEATLSAARSLVRSATGPTEVRVRRTMEIARYRRLEL